METGQSAGVEIASGLQAGTGLDFLLSVRLNMKYTKVRGKLQCSCSCSLLQAQLQLRLQ